MTEVKEILKRLKRLKTFYENHKDTKYLILEEYREYVENKVKKPNYVVEIKDYNKYDAEKDLSDEQLSKVAKNLFIRQRTSLASEFNTDKTYVPLTGQGIATRLNRLYHMVQLKTIQPPGFMANNSPHMAFPVVDVDLIIRAADDMPHCNYPVDRLTNARYLASKNVSPDVKALQSILHNLQYDDEMEWEKFKDDGVYMDRTKAALSAFIEEVNFLETGMITKPLSPTSGEVVTSAIAVKLLKKCQEVWARPQYYKLTDSKWDYSIKSASTKEGIWRSCYHVRQLQNDLKLFGFDPTVDASGKPNPKLLDGIFGPLTESTLKKFQEAALQGMRINLETGKIKMSGKTTFKGTINGILDKPTKDELALWLGFGQDPNVIIPIRDFIRYVEEVEQTYPETPAETISRIRFQYYGINSFLESIMFKQLIPDAKVSETILIPPPPHSRTQMTVPVTIYKISDEALKHLKAKARENKEIPDPPDNPSPYIVLDDGTWIDAGHLLLGLDALLHPRTDTPFITYGIPNIDPASWVADVGIAVVWMEEHPFKEAPKKLPLADVDEYWKMSAPKEDLIGDVDSFGLYEEWNNLSIPSLSLALKTYYLGQISGVKNRWKTFCKANGLTYTKQGNSIVWDTGFLNDIISKVNRFADLYADLPRAGFSMLPLADPPTRRIWKFTPIMVEKFLDFVKSNLEKE